VGYKFWKKTKWVKLAEMDIWTGRRQYPPEDEENAFKKKTLGRKIKNVVVG
jgi:amino acid transporter